MIVLLSFLFVKLIFLLLIALIIKKGGTINFLNEVIGHTYL